MAASPAPPAAILKDAGLFALVALGLCIPIVSHRTDLGSDGLELTPRWGLVAGLVAAVFAVRLVQRLVLERRAARGALSPSPHQATEPVGAEPNAGQRLPALGLPLFVGFALFLPLIAALASGGLSPAR